MFVVSMGARDFHNISRTCNPNPLLQRLVSFDFCSNLHDFLNITPLCAQQPSQEILIFDEVAEFAECGTKYQYAIG